MTFVATNREAGGRFESPAYAMASAALDTGRHSTKAITRAFSQWSPVAHVFGLLASALAVFMAIPGLVDLLDGNPEWHLFAWTAGATLFLGMGLVFGNRRGAVRLDQRQAFLLTTLAWVGLPVFGGLPFYFSSYDVSFAEAYFETVSGLTTTGSTILVGLDSMPRGILLWRALLQWIGGIGIIAMALAVLPFLNIGGMQLFRTESSDRSDKVMAKASAFAVAIFLVYVLVSLLCAALFWAEGMTLFEAVCHAATALSTGGYSTSDASIAHWGSPAIHWTATVFMAIGGMPLVFFVRLCQGQRREVWRDGQVLWFLGICAAATAILALYLVARRDAPVLDALRLAAFNAVSIITTTGFAIDDYNAWGPFPVFLFFVITFVGGCTGSTAGAIKIFRIQILWKVAVAHMHSMLYPHAVQRTRYDGKPVDGEIVRAICIFLLVYMVTVGLVAAVLALTGCDFITAISGAATAVANVGPGLGEIIGPAGNFSTLTDTAKWALSAGMLLGRLEFFTLLVVLMPSFWRR